MVGYDSQVVNTPYDDVFRTLLNDCSQLIIPIINETFGEHYTGDETIIFHPNEHFLDKQDGNADKRITDSSFTIVGEKEQCYLYECQSTADSSMVVRIFEYATQIAIEQGELIQYTLKVQIPQCAVLFLRSTKRTPENMQIEMETPGGTTLFKVPITKVQKYSLEEILEKNLLFLIPFYIFSHESRFVEYDTKEEKLKELKDEYVKIMDHLDQLLTEGKISAYIRKTLIEMSSKVLENIAKKYENVKEGVRTVMGGRILEYEAKTILKEGIKQGVEQGIKQGVEQGMTQGKIQGQKETVLNLHNMGMEDDFIAKAVNVSIELVRQWIGLTKA